MHAGFNRMKTWVLIAALGGLFVLIGAWLGGTSGAVVALAIALVFNFSMYWFSDKIAIATTQSKPVTEEEYPQLYRIVRELAQLDQMPMPKIYVSDMCSRTRSRPAGPAARLGRRDEGHPQIVDDRELRGVLAHELSHVRNRDILIGSVAAAIGMSIVLLSRFAFFFGGGDDNRGGGIRDALRHGSWRRSPPRSSRWRSRARASTRPTSRGPTSRTIPLPWRARSASSRWRRSRFPPRPR